jgi:hypothetical protein
MTRFEGCDSVNDTDSLCNDKTLIKKENSNSSLSQEQLPFIDQVLSSNYLR